MTDTKQLTEEELEKVSGGKIWYFQYDNYNGITKKKLMVTKFSETHKKHRISAFNFKVMMNTVLVCVYCCVCVIYRRLCKSYNMLYRYCVCVIR